MHQSLRLSQNLQQTQRLMLSPRMQQSLKLLALPTLELSNLIQQELVENPLLEEADSRYVGSIIAALARRYIL